MVKFIYSKYKFDNVKKTSILLGLQGVKYFINIKLLIIKTKNQQNIR
jgi:hypothetical protein